ncbi:hypothetical protein [Quadrisphaera sp. DSM 44207]|uniref:hypothetical protein n=1 Tax=Quadrisphaera sp. DSM 44207 TaxID=1881057 RepID=UPI000889A8DA|nr:hypothetical protein [Quadrisphaera sp. DSM 44207]SDQ22412.1 hypothetical protein SAMN05428996_1163 [Quadrisphaera sp. DSM 44207]
MKDQPSPRRALSGLPSRTQPPTALGASSPARLLRSNRLGASGPDEQPQAAAPAAAVEVGTPGPDDSDAARDPDFQSSGRPKYLRLVRRETRMHPHQVDQLTQLSRALNEARRGGRRSGTGERITDNTLVRVAVDLLLTHPERLSGTTEDELRASVGLAPLDLRADRADSGR